MVTNPTIATWMHCLIHALLVGAYTLQSISLFSTKMLRILGELNVVGWILKNNVDRISIYAFLNELMHFS